MNTQVLDLLASTIGIFLCTVFWYVLWKPLCVAELRQSLFDARDFLFDLVAENQTSLRFDSEVYRGTREDINVMIRYAHKVSLFGSFLTRAINPQLHTNSQTRTAALRKNLSDEELRIIKLVDKRQSKSIFRFLLRCSPLLWIAAVVSVLIVVFVVVYKVCREGFSKITAYLDFLLWNMMNPIIEAIELSSGQRYLLGSSADGIPQYR